MRSLLFLILFVRAISADAAALLDRAKITEVVNQVNIIDTATRRTLPARVDDMLLAPHVMRTGANSRAELVADDKTVTRVGSHTLFSFVPNSREIDLQQGSLLFHSPSGKGGGRIRTPSATAAVLGTTLIVAATGEGGMKVLMLEGRGTVAVPGGKVHTLRAGQMIILLAGRPAGEVMQFQLGPQVAAARLIQGFQRRLPSMDRIHAERRTQQRDFAREQRDRRDGQERRPPPREGDRQQQSGGQPAPRPGLAGGLPPPPGSPGGLLPPPQPQQGIDALRERSAFKPPPPPPPPPPRR